MAFPISAALLDAIVLAVVARESTYGYKITQDVQGRQLVDLRPGNRGAHPALLPDYARGAGKACVLPRRLGRLPQFH